MALGVVTLRTIEYIVDASTNTFLMAVFCAQKCGKILFEYNLWRSLHRFFVLTENGGRKDEKSSDFNG